MGKHEKHKPDFSIRPIIFACSGGSNVGEITDLVARKLLRGKEALMSCPPALSGRIESYLTRLKEESQVIVLDGCPKDCVAKTMQHAGFSGFLHIRLSDLDLHKWEADVDEGSIEKVIHHIRKLLNDSSVWDIHCFLFNQPKNDLK